MRALLIVMLVLMGKGMMAQPIIVAHRGASWDAPENTVASALLAWELGADAVEVDVYMAKDNRIMVIHDKDTKRTAAGKKNMVVKSTPSLVLRDLDVGSWKDDSFKGEKIPFLDEIIQTVPENKLLIIEIKDDRSIIPHLKRNVDKSGKKEQII